MKHYAPKLWCLASVLAATLIYLLVFGTPGATASDNKMYLWFAIVINLLLMGCLLALARLISKTGGFRWICKNRSVHLTLVVTGLLLATSANIIGCVYNFGGAPGKGPMEIYWRIAPVLLLLLLLISPAILVYSPPGLRIYLRLVRWSFRLIFVVSIIGISTVGLNYLRAQTIKEQHPEKPLAADTAYHLPGRRAMTEGCKQASKHAKIVI
jgi:hypothetical protein